MTEKINAVFFLVAEIGYAQGVRDLKNKPPWVLEFGSWKIVTNGKDKPVQWERTWIPPFSMYIEFNGWPAGTLNAHGGGMVAGGIANEAILISELEKLKGGIPE